MLLVPGGKRLSIDRGLAASVRLLSRGVALIDSPISMSLLGGFELRRHGEPVSLPQSTQRLLAFLALHGRPVLRMYLGGCLWPESPEPRAGANLRSALWRLRRSGVSVVEPDGSLLRLSPEVLVDFQETSFIAQGLLDRDVRLEELELERASLFDDLLPDWYDDWVVVERERFRQLRLHALEALCERLTEVGRFAQAVEAGLAAVAGEPLRESAHRTLIRTYIAEGNVAEAIRQYCVYRRLLNDELGVDPSPELEALVRG
jgi:DNA-binding SARP family transcriptional activator